MTKPGLKQQIRMAPSETEIDRLLEVGKTYVYASEPTKSSWQNAAQKRRNELRREPQKDKKE